ncbi:MAG TPA: VOC family protein [Spirochaetia bacterium]|nr:VOC family protein [Spirochaetia bacterium]
MNEEAYPLIGIHHVSALSAHIDRTNEFYPQVLGLRPIIKTVNQDEPSMYHLFYGDGVGSPGSDLTIFDLPHASQEVRGNNSITKTTFRVHGKGVFDYWEKRLQEHGVDGAYVTERDGRTVLELEDPEGIQLSLVDDGGEGESYPWNESPVPAEYQIRGLGYVEVTVPSLELTQRFLSGALGMVNDHTYPLAGFPEFAVHVFRIGTGGAHAEVHIIVRDDLPRARYGAGGVHHVALRTPRQQVMSDWSARLDELDYRNSGVVDRHFFTSIYVREPNGVLFELATDGPGFEVDGPLDADRLSLPPFLEDRRSEIEAQLLPLKSTTR